MTPLRGQHHQVEGVGRLHLEPGSPPPAGLVGCVQGLHHHPLVAPSQRLPQELGRLRNLGHDDPR